LSVGCLASCLEVRATWALFRRLTDGKALKDCNRDDGRKLAAYFGDQGLKRAKIPEKGHVA
jgi:hypothetical protein